MSSGSGDDLAIAEAEAAAQLAAAIGAASIAGQATVQAANIQAQADEQIANTQAKAARDVAVTRFNADTVVAATQAGADTGVADRNREATEYGADQQLAGVHYAQDAESQRLATTLQFAQDKWNQVWPLIGGILGGGSGGGSQSGASWDQLLTALGGPPYISQGGVFTPAQVQQRLNLVYSRADRKSATELHDAEIELAGRGYAGSSPLLAMLEFSYEAAGIQASVMGAQEVLLSSAQANSQQMLAQQQARQEQYAAQEAAFNALNKIAADLSASILQSVTSMVGQMAR